MIMIITTINRVPNLRHEHHHSSHPNEVLMYARFRRDKERSHTLREV